MTTNNAAPALAARNPAIAAVVALALALALALACIALWLRLPGFDGRAFWNDELWRITLFLDSDPVQTYLFHPDAMTAITSPLYLALLKA